MSFIKNIFPYIFILLFFIPKTFAQVTGNKSSTLEFDSSDTLKIIEDSVNVENPDNMLQPEDYYEVPDNESMIYIYFDWMPGHGKYNNFDILSTHYKHTTSIMPDTLILGEYAHPAPYKIYSNYGWRRRRMHYGVDLSYPMGTPVVAAFDGIVRVSKSNAGGYGQLVVIRHDNGLETYYAHLSKRLVNPGQLVMAGDTIALGGSTGRSTGPHLHFETRYMGVPFNPTKIIDFNKFTLVVDTLYTTGKEVKLSPEAEKKAAEQEMQSRVYHKVRRGECLSTIARKYRTSITAIKRLNGMKSDFLREGQRLRVR